MTKLQDVIVTDPEIQGGTPVFRGTRVPVRNLLDHLAGGGTLPEFLDDYPSVSREQARAALELAKEALAAGASPPLRILPRVLKRHLTGVEVESVVERGWSGLKNGELLDLAADHFDVFLTADQNIEYQQNLEGRGIGVVVLAAVSNRLEDLLPLLPSALEQCDSIEKGEVWVVRSSSSARDT